MRFPLLRTRDIANERCSGVRSSGTRPASAKRDVTHSPWTYGPTRSNVRAMTQRFGVRLRELRVGRHLSQEAFADLCGLDRTYISSLERGRRNPTLTTLSQIADALGMPVGELLKGV